MKKEDIRGRAAAGGGRGHGDVSRVVYLGKLECVVLSQAREVIRVRYAYMHVRIHSVSTKQQLSCGLGQRDQGSKPSFFLATPDFLFGRSRC